MVSHPTFRGSCFHERPSHLIPSHIPLDRVLDSKFAAINPHDPLLAVMPANLHAAIGVSRRSVSCLLSLASPKVLTRKKPAPLPG